MTTELMPVSGNGHGVSEATENVAKALETVVMGGDLSRMPAPQRLAYYGEVCRSIGLNPITQPFQYVVLQGGKMSLYATRNCTDQLRANREINITIVSRETLGDTGIYVVTARATTPSGRSDESTGAINIKGLQGEPLANALMKAETKAKRRVTLSICGLSFADDSEVDSIPGAARIQVDTETGEIHEQPEPSRNADPDRAMKRVHAVGREKGLDHDAIKTLAVGMMAERGAELAHLSDLGEKGLDGLANYLARTDAETLAARVASYQAGGRVSKPGSWVATNGADETYNRETEADAKDVTGPETPEAPAKPEVKRKTDAKTAAPKEPLSDVREGAICTECKAGKMDAVQYDLSVEAFGRPVCAPCGVALSAKRWQAGGAAEPMGADEDPFHGAAPKQEALAV